MNLIINRKRAIELLSIHSFFNLSRFEDLEPKVDEVKLVRLCK